MKRRIALSGILLAALASVSAAQTRVIAGTVHLIRARTPVAGAQVVISGTELGAYTDSLGRFIIRGLPDRPLRIEVERLGVVAFDTLTAGDNDVMVALLVDPDTTPRATAIEASYARSATTPVRVRGSRGASTVVGPDLGRVIRIVARDACSKEALHSVLVHALGTNSSGFTDANGTFTLRQLSGNPVRFGVRGIGYAPGAAVASAGGDTTVTVLLASERAPTSTCSVDVPDRANRAPLSSPKTAVSATARTTGRPTPSRAH